MIHMYYMYINVPLVNINLFVQEIVTVLQIGSMDTDSDRISTKSNMFYSFGDGGGGMSLLTYGIGHDFQLTKKKWYEPDPGLEGFLCPLEEVALHVKVITVICTWTRLYVLKR